jgi:hypothetical protein
MNPDPFDAAIAIALVIAESQPAIKKILTNVDSLKYHIANASDRTAVCNYALDLENKRLLDTFTLLIMREICFHIVVASDERNLRGKKPSSFCFAEERKTGRLIPIPNMIHEYLDEAIHVLGIAKPSAKGIILP